MGAVMEPVTCIACQAPLTASALSCPACGRPIEAEPTKKAGPLTAVIGALFLIAGPFMPWLTYKIESVSGVEETRKQALIFVGLGVFALMFAVSALTGKKFTGLRGNISAGLVAAGISIYFYIEIGSLIGEGGASPQWGSGMYFCIVGAALVLLGGLLTRSPKPKQALSPTRL